MDPDPQALGEFELIRRYFTRPPKRALVGVGDDCALVRPDAGLDLAITTDMLIEGRHFLPDAEPPGVCGVGEVRWERRMPHACEFGLAFRTTTGSYRDLIRDLRRAARERSRAGE